MKTTCETCAHYHPEWIDVRYGDWSYCEYWHADRRSGETCERHEPKEGGEK